MSGEKFSTALIPAADHEVDHLLGRRGRHGDDGDADAVAARDLLQIVNVEDRDAGTRLLPDLRRQRVEERADLEAFLAKPRVVCQRQAEVARANDRHP